MYSQHIEVEDVDLSIMLLENTKWTNNRKRKFLVQGHMKKFHNLESMEMPNITKLLIPQKSDFLANLIINSAFL